MKRPQSGFPFAAKDIISAGENGVAYWDFFVIDKYVDYSRVCLWSGVAIIQFGVSFSQATIFFTQKKI